MIDNYKVENQGTIIETIGVLGGTFISILFDFDASYSFIFSSVVEQCVLTFPRQIDRWQVELATSSHVAIYSIILGCELDLGTFSNTIDFCVVPLGSYGVFFGDGLARCPSCLC